MIIQTHDLRAHLSSLCLKLLCIPSVTGHEAVITNYLETWARGLKQLTSSDILRDGNGLIIGRIDPQRPSIALVGHTDTVPPHSKDGRPCSTNDWVIGRGASDMKGGIAVMQAIFELQTIATLPYNIILILYDQEEGPYLSNGLQKILDRYSYLQEIDLAIAMEPTDNTVQLGCMGTLNVQVTFKGQAAHAARPWEGNNAIHLAGPLLTHLLTRPYNDVDVQGYTFRESMSVTLAQGGTVRNVLPHLFTININHRFAPHTDTQQAIDAIKTLIASYDNNADISIVDCAPAGSIPNNNLILQHWQQIASFNMQPKLAWTDVARLMKFGIDAINFGPGAGSQAHQAGEYICIDAMVESYNMLLKLFTAPLPRASH